MTKSSDIHITETHRVTRCAIYTRKSSEEGLEQAFNSLDAQRETCEAYVSSQKHEGWTVLPEMYDDGGISGGTLERPALRRMLDDIEAGTIDTVVVYKVDRLTRSLSDFAKIVDTFEKNDVTFVSVTQSFNTTTSMGRLTLNMLLSFAQFEREVAGERIRDKIAASKRKGMWMGGHPPLGYDVLDRKLVINEAEADTVRHIFGRYAELASVRALKDQLESAGIVSKRRTDRFGRETGGKPIARGALYAMLQNRLYLGQITHKGASYSGEHDAIIEESLWETVQSTLAKNRIDRKMGVGTAEPSLLTGIVFDEHGERLTPTHANKKGTRYRYYVSHSLISRGRDKSKRPGQRVPAGELEQLVETNILNYLNDGSALHQFFEPIVPDAAHRDAMVTQAVKLSNEWIDLASPDKRDRLLKLVARIELRANALVINLRSGGLTKLLSAELGVSPPSSESPEIALSVPTNLRRAGKGMRLLIDDEKSSTPPPPDRSLVRLLGQAHRFHTMAMQGNGASIATLAKAANVDPSYFTRVLKLSFLAPNIVSAILSGRQPAHLTALQLIRRAGNLAGDWSAQREQLGFY